MKVIVLLTLLIFLPLQALASPFLVCDKYDVTATQPQYFKILGLPSGPVQVPPDPSGTFGFKYDVVNLQSGSYTVTAIACIAGDTNWPVEVCSDSSNPLSLTVPSRPLKPLNPKLVK